MSYGLDGSVLRFYDRALRRNLMTPKEERLQAQNARSEAKAARSEAEAANARAAEETAKRKQLEAELARLHRSASWGTGLSRPGAPFGRVSKMLAHSRDK